MSDFTPTDFQEFLEMDKTPVTSGQIGRLTRQLDKVVHNLSDAQVTLSNLAVRYEYIVSHMEHNHGQLKESIGSLSRELTGLETRVADVEKFMWKFTGALLIISVLGQYLINKFLA